MINASLVCLELLPNFQGENLITFRLIFMVEIWQRFSSGASWHTKHYSHQVFTVRMRQWGWPILTAKIRQSFTFGVLWRIGKVSCLCIWRVLTCLCQDDSKPLKTLSTLICVAYMGKPMSLGDMDQDGQVVVTMHRVLHEYAPTVNALSTYSCLRLRALMAREGLSRSHDGPLYKVHDHPHTQRHIYIYASCIMQNAITQSTKVNRHCQCPKGIAQ